MSKIRKKEMVDHKKKKSKEAPSAPTVKKSKWQDFIGKHAVTKQQEEKNIL